MLNRRCKTNKVPLFSFNVTNLSNSNQRKAVRYVRQDIKASLPQIRLFKFGNPFKIKLHDISSRGALISTDKKISTNKKLTLILEFTKGERFEIPAKIVRRTIGTTNYYGITFEKCNDRLGDYLLETQTELIFK